MRYMAYYCNKFIHLNKILDVNIWSGLNKNKNHVPICGKLPLPTTYLYLLINFNSLIFSSFSDIINVKLLLLFSEFDL